MRPVCHPPDPILRAYADLLNQLFLSLRGRSHSRRIDLEELHDLADAMHNIGAIFADYGDWTDDDKYRELYLRPFDEKWRKKFFRLEQFLDERLNALRANAPCDRLVGDRATNDLRVVRLSAAELALLNNSLHEVLHGIGIDEPEFNTRLGASRDDAERLLDRIGRLVNETNPGAAPDRGGA